MAAISRIALTPGEPAGIGPDLAALIAARAHDAEIVAVADPELLAARARALGLDLHLEPFDSAADPAAQRPHTLKVQPVTLARPAIPGRLDAANSGYVLETLEQAAALCLHGTCDALVTGPVQKSVINDAGIPFSGHTEFLAERTGAALPVMMLATPGLRVALATTHLPLRAVPERITDAGLTQVLHVLDADLRAKFAIIEPRILVAGLNPHAGEGGHLGREEIEIIAPVLERLRAAGMRLTGPLPADTLFTPHHLERADAVLAMYHDQGLPVVKHKGFGSTVNVTLGLPIVRTSVDHGTALDLAGTDRADSSSLEAAIAMAIELGRQRRRCA